MWKKYRNRAWSNGWDIENSEKNCLWGGGWSSGIWFWTCSVIRVLDTQAQKLSLWLFRGAVQGRTVGSAWGKYLKALSLMRLAKEWVYIKGSNTEHYNMPVDLGTKQCITSDHWEKKKTKSVWYPGKVFQGRTTDSVWQTLPLSQVGCCLKSAKNVLDSGTSWWERR